MAANSFKEDEDLKEVWNIKTIFRLMSYMKQYKVSVLITLVLMMITVSVELFNPYFLKLGIDNYIHNKDIKGLLFLTGIMVIINSLSMLCARKRILVMSKVTNSILLSIRQQLYNHIQKLSFSFFDSRPVGKILARIVGDVNSLNELLSNSVTNLLPNIIKIIAAVIIMLSMNFKLGLIGLTTLPFLLISMFSVQIFSHKRWQLYRKKNSNMNAFTHEDFSGIKVVQSFTAESITSRTFGGLLKEHRNAFLRAVRLNDFFWPLVELSWGLGVVIVFWYGLKLIDTGTITVGLLVSFIGYIGLFWMPIMEISNFYNLLVTNIVGAERIFEILDLKPDIDENQKGKILPTIRGRVEFKNVTFSYDSKMPVLKNISFHIEEGETIALVGPTGVGKTTIVNLISRFYDVQQGEVLIDNYNVNEVTLESLRSQMGIMLQDTFLFAGSIKDNIRYGKLDASEDEIIMAAKAVQAHDFIMKMPQGYDTNVNERGSRLSVGQRQLIAFARALLADPRILILDEATASIDTHTERLVQQGIERLLRGRTSFVIAHRLSTIQKADRIMVINHGRITEVGSHGELMDRKGLYYQLVMAQFKLMEEQVV